MKFTLVALKMVILKVMESASGRTEMCMKVSTKKVTKLVQGNLFVKMEAGATMVIGSLVKCVVSECAGGKMAHFIKGNGEIVLRKDREL
jgi:hypothetical protein